MSLECYMKVSHEDSFVITLFCAKMKKRFGKVIVKRGNIHNFLGLDFNWTKKEHVKVSMIKCLKETIVEFPKEIKGSATLPAGDRLFNVRPDSDPKEEILPEELAQGFHRTTKPLWCCG